ncbi:MAG: hypothetical protein Q4E41_03750 [Bacteroidales bacterium]|nr:hypothetical protein [Bacteroidales bacterium]
MNEWHTFRDKVICTKVGDGWKISDVVRDGKSTKSHWRNAPPMAA